MVALILGYALLKGGPVMFVHITKICSFFLAKVGNSSWWITGGLSKDGSSDSTEVFNEALSSPNKMKDGPTLPFKIYGHCMLTLPNDGVRNVRLCTWILKNQVGKFKFEELDF